MPANQIVGPVGLTGVEFETWLLKFDKSGACISPRTRQALLERLAANQATPVLVFSHGWKNEYGDALALYTGFLKELQTHLDQRGAGRPKPLFVGIIWPSTWLSFDTGPEIAAEPALSRQEGADAFKRELAGNLADPAQRDAFYALCDAPHLGADDALKLAGLVVDALAAQPAASTSDAAEKGARDAGVMLAGARALGTLGQGAASPGEQPGAGGLGEGGTVDQGPAAGPRDAGMLGLLDPRELLRVASVYQMKDRAGTVGWNGVSALVHDILVRSRAPLHMAGHSFGAKVVLSAILACQLPPDRKVASALLLEPAISYLCFASQVPGSEGTGGYRDVLGKIGKSLLMTYSAHDFPLHDVFHLALRRREDLGEVHVSGAPGTAAGAPPNEFAALGGYGPRGAGERLLQPLPEPGSIVEIPAPLVPLAFDGTQFDRIRSHGDVANPYTTWLMYAQLT